MLSKKVIDDLEYLHAKTVDKHGPHGCNMTCLGALTEEYHEVVEAVRTNENWRIRKELLDVANVCIRRIMEIDELP